MSAKALWDSFAKRLVENSLNNYGVVFHVKFQAEERSALLLRIKCNRSNNNQPFYNPLPIGGYIQKV